MAENHIIENFMWPKTIYGRMAYEDAQDNGTLDKTHGFCSQVDARLSAVVGLSGCRRGFSHLNVATMLSS